MRGAASLPHGGSACARSSAAACAWISGASSACPAPSPDLRPRQCSIEDFNSTRPRYSPASATGGVR